MALTVARRTRRGSAWGAARRGRCHAPESGLLSELPCGATLSSPPSFAPHHCTCHPAHKTSLHFPSPALSRPAGRWPGPALVCPARPPPPAAVRRARVPLLHPPPLPGPRAAPALGISAGVTPCSEPRTHGKAALHPSRPRLLFERRSSTVPFGASVISAMKSGQK